MVHYVATQRSLGATENYDHKKHNWALDANFHDGRVQLSPSTPLSHPFNPPLGILRHHEHLVPRNDRGRAAKRLRPSELPSCRQYSPSISHNPSELEVALSQQVDACLAKTHLVSIENFS